MGDDIAPIILSEYANTASAGSIIAFHHHRRGLQAGDLDRADELAHSLLEEGITAMKIWPFDPIAKETGGQYITPIPPGLIIVFELTFLLALLSTFLSVLIAEIGDRTQIGAVHLASSLVAVLQLVAAAVLDAHRVELVAAGRGDDALADRQLQEGDGAHAAVAPAQLDGRRLPRR